MKRAPTAATRGMTLIEIIVALAVMTMIALMIFGAFDSLSRGRKGEALRSERAREGRDAMNRMVRELSSAFLSLHTPNILALQTRLTGFYGQSASDFDRVDFTSFAHRRITKEARESDQSEIGYFVVRDPDVDGKMDLVRREQAPIDMDFKKGGVVNVLAEDVEKFDVKYLDPMTGQWLETWDSVQTTAQFNRLPLEIRIELQLKPVRNTPPFHFVTKLTMPMQQPLQFGITQ